MDRLTIDLARCMTGETIPRGLTPELMDGLRPRLDAALAAVHAAAGTGWLEWTELPFQDPEGLMRYAAANHGKYDAVVVIGIGGSALGTIALATALLPFYWNELSASRRRHAPRLYVLDNVDLIVLFPNGRISNVQRRMMTTSGASNVHALAIEGHFDDCQAIVKAMFNHHSFRDAVSLSGLAPRTAGSWSLPSAPDRLRPKPSCTPPGSRR